MEKYKDNKLAIEKLYEERETAFAESNDLKNQLEDAQVKYHRLELQKREGDIRLSEAKYKIERLTDIEKQIENLKAKKHEIDLEKLELELKLNEANRRLNASKQNALLTFVTSTFGAILFTLGANIVASQPQNWLAWILSAAGIIIGFIAFFISRRNN